MSESNSRQEPPETNVSRRTPASKSAWPLPSARDASDGARHGFAWSSVAATPNLGMAALGLGAGAFRLKYRTSEQ